MKITFSERNLFLLMALMSISFIFNSCRKDLLVQSPDSLRSSLSIAEAKSYFNSHITAGKGENTNARVMFSTAGGPSLADVLDNKRPMWDHAFQKMMATGQAVKIPIDFGERAYAMVSGYKKEVVPLSSLNYLFMYRDSLQKIHAEWVVLLPDSAWLYGNRNAYTGRIWVRDWEGNTLKNYYYGSRPSKSSKGSRVTNSESNVENAESLICIIVPTGNCPRIGACWYTCDMCFRVCAKQFCGWVPVCGPECEIPVEPSVGGSTGSGNGSGGGNPGGNGSGGGAGPSDYPPACISDPNYIPPIFPPANGGSWQIPCNGPETVPMPQPISLPPDILWTPEEVDFLSQYPEIQNTINNYLSHHPNSTDAVDFAKWAVAYLTANSSINITQFLTEFFPTGPEQVADPNADNWTDPDNQILFDPDQTVYQQYQDNQPWPTINRVIDYEKFVPIRKKTNNPDEYENCLILAKEQLGKAGYTCSGFDESGVQTFSIYTEQNGVNTAKTKQAISYLISALQQNIPVFIGVDNRPGTPSPKNRDNSTDHYVVIVGMGIDDKGKYFQFVDNATDNRSTGASYSNRLYYNAATGKITGKTAITNYRNQAGMHDYIVTQVRKSIKK